jgi:hypothetical protein
MMHLSTLSNLVVSFSCLPVNLVVMSYDSEGTTKVLYEPKANYEIDIIEAMIDKNNHFISKVQMNYIMTLIYL